MIISHWQSVFNNYPLYSVGDDWGGGGGGGGGGGEGGWGHAPPPPKAM